MANSLRIASIVCLAFAILLYFSGIKRTIEYDDHSNGFMYLSGIFVLIATILEAVQKGGKLKTKQILDLLIVLIAVLLLFMAAARRWGILASSLIVTISILTSVQFVLKDDN